jgi:hypothetical protein
MKSWKSLLPTPAMISKKVGIFIISKAVVKSREYFLGSNSKRSKKARKTPKELSSSSGSESESDNTDEVSGDELDAYLSKGKGSSSSKCKNRGKGGNTPIKKYNYKKKGGKNTTTIKKDYSNTDPFEDEDQFWKLSKQYCIGLTPSCSKCRIYNYKNRKIFVKKNRLYKVDSSCRKCARVGFMISSALYSLTDKANEDE